MDIRKEFEGDRLTVHLDGILETTTAEQLMQEIKPELKSINYLVLDMAELKYITSAGLRVILTFQKKLKSKNKITTKNTNENLRELFDLTGFNKILNVE